MEANANRVLNVVCVEARRMKVADASRQWHHRFVTYLLNCCLVRNGYLLSGSVQIGLGGYFGKNPFLMNQ